MKMVESLRVAGIKIKDQDKDLRNIAMVIPMKECLKMEKRTSMVYTNGKMGRLMRVSGLMGKEVALVNG